MNKYRKKPIIVEARQWDGSNVDEMIAWIGDGKFLYNPFGQELMIDTWEGMMTARKHDYIIKGIQGEFYPCKFDVFMASYDLVQE